MRSVEQADRDGLDVVSLSDHPYIGSASGFLLFPPGNTEHTAADLARWAQEIVPAVREAIAQD